MKHFLVRTCGVLCFLVCCRFSNGAPAARQKLWNLRHQPTTSSTTDGSIFNSTIFHCIIYTILLLDVILLFILVHYNLGRSCRGDENGKGEPKKNKKKDLEETKENPLILTEQQADETKQSTKKESASLSGTVRTPTESTSTKNTKKPDLAPGPSNAKPVSPQATKIQQQTKEATKLSPVQEQKKKKQQVTRPKIELLMNPLFMKAAKTHVTPSTILAAAAGASASGCSKEASERAPAASVFSGAGSNKSVAPFTTVNSVSPKSGGPKLEPKAEPQPSQPQQAQPPNAKPRIVVIDNWSIHKSSETFPKPGPKGVPPKGPKIRLEEVSTTTESTEEAVENVF